MIGICIVYYANVRKNKQIKNVCYDKGFFMGLKSVFI